MGRAECGQRKREEKKEWKQRARIAEKASLSQPLVAEHTWIP